MQVPRRIFLASTILSGAALSHPSVAFETSSKRVSNGARWLDGRPPDYETGQTFGLAWPRGALGARTSLRAVADDGASIAVQSWNVAFWPDGSVKWTGHALPAGITSERVRIEPGRPTRPEAPVSVERRGTGWIVRSAAVEWHIASGTDAIVRSVDVNGRRVMGPVRLKAIMATSAEGQGRRPLDPIIETITVEQSGPVRAVVRLDGRHSQVAPHLPVSLRLYFHAGSNAMRVVHSFTNDCDPEKHFLSGIGISADVPLSGEAYDRHIRVALGDERLLAEAARPLTGLRRDSGMQVRTAQVEGRAVPLAEMNPVVRDRLDAIPIWNDFRLLQHAANGFVLQKRTGTGHAWIGSDEGRRAPGFASVSSPAGGAALSMRYFWQRHPSALTVDALGGEVTSLTGWLWSPDALPMDMRSYRGVMGMEGYDAQNAGLEITYEDYEPGWDQSFGIARTSELTLWALPATPAADEIRAMARGGAEPARLVAEPEHLHRAAVFGDWSLPDRSTPARAAIENQLANLVDFYSEEVDRRSWYGFWDHGDVMHSYDADRRQWRYDIGGYAWDNSELSTDLWLWYQALRTGDAKSFRLAEAMTRHTGEVDVYHLGRFAGFGTRHGVQHFSDSSKQPRISTSIYRRIFYYLTCDERTGDLMRALLGSAERLLDIEIGRKVPGRVATELPPRHVEMSFGTVWSSLAANWLTEWERTGKRKWRDHIVAGMESIGAMPNGWLTGNAPYNLDTGRFVPVRKLSISHLNAVFGAVELNSELLQLLDVPAYRAAWLNYCRFYNAPPAEFEAQYGKAKLPFNLREGHSRLTAYAANRLKNPDLAARASGEFFSGQAGLGTLDHDPRVAAPGGMVEWPGLSTNAAAQWGLAAIQNLALIGSALDEAFVPGSSKRSRARP
ncbi:exo-rhamnogalacturonan lyase family protein [Sphingopyxis sp. MWB1]|uniref:exo-rhamnogalacturonan lyase family protein n=1 Tax=Sphingopyxis sp. MWB1 TaxID=1537715 RepID=UPI0009DEB0F6|nr:Tat pathway signal sequence domain protein [Sphingopyxis sp. MWB1]